MIRGKLHKCPFGLPIPEGCSSAGGSGCGSKFAAIYNMTPLESLDKDSILEAKEYNQDQLLLVEEPKKCPYADAIVEKKNTVDCKFDAKQPLVPAGNVGLNGSPLHPGVVVGDMPQAQYGYPLDYYSDNNENQRVYYNLSSLVG